MPRKPLDGRAASCDAMGLEQDGPEPFLLPSPSAARREEREGGTASRGRRPHEWRVALEIQLLAELPIVLILQKLSLTRKNRAGCALWPVPQANRGVLRGDIEVKEKALKSRAEHLGFSALRVVFFRALRKP